MVGAQGHQEGNDFAKYERGGRGLRLGKEGKCQQNGKGAVEMKKGAIIITALLSGCASGPGMQMDESQLQVVHQAQQRDVAQNERPSTIIPITPAVVSNLGQQQMTDPPAHSLQSLQHAIQDYKYTIEPQDVLSITVWDHPELMTPTVDAKQAVDAAWQDRIKGSPGYTVARDGTIYFPYAGKVPVTGKTADEVRELLASRLAKYIRHPQLEVHIASYRSQKINVTGEVKKPGVLTITDVPMTVLEAINESQGPTAEADLSQVSVTRNGRTELVNVQDLDDKGDSSQNILLKNGDQVNVGDRSKNKIYVMGEVKKAGAYMMHKGRLSLAEAIGSADGIDQTAADARRIYVIRQNGNQPTIYRLNGNSPDAMLLAARFQLQPQDVVYVSTSEVTRWGRILGQLLPNLGALPYMIHP